MMAAAMLFCTACSENGTQPDILGNGVLTEENISELTEKNTEAGVTAERSEETSDTADDTTESDTQNETIADTNELPVEEETSEPVTATSAVQPTTTPAETTASTAAVTAATTAAVTSAAASAATVTTVTAAETTTTFTEAVTVSEATTLPETVVAETKKPVAETVDNFAMRDLTTAQIVKDMGLGINLGNTMESCGDWINSSGGVRAYETAWGSPVITDDMIKGYAKCGFGVLRIPVAWSNLMSSDYTISPDYMARVKEITDWALDSGMYVIVNIHYDGGWWEKFPVETEECMKKYTRIWEQISETFKDYSDKLVFESLNEEGGWGSMWNRYSGTTNGKSDSFELLNRINQRFVDTVRTSGGNNPLRHLLIAGYNTDVELTCDKAFSMPQDKANRCAVSVHYYTPPTFCILEEDASWGKAKADWGSSSDIAELKKYMDMMKKNFVDKGIPVIIGEYGVALKNKQPETIRLFLSSVAKEAYDRDMCPVLWDVTNVFYDRQKCKFIDDILLERIMSAKQ